MAVPIIFCGFATNMSTLYVGFNLTGDFILGNGLKKLGKLLDRGVKVALVYGDRDYQCNWLGGEAISLALESKLSSGFKNAGYANIQTNSSYVGGLVRQYGNLSFSRIFQAAHGGEFLLSQTRHAIPQ
jgi:carboxypeptidase C (cathepsin A)